MDSILLDSLIVLALLLISAFFSAAETGITAASRAKVHKLKMEGNWRAKLVAKLRQEKEKLIGGILFGNNVVNIAASAITTSLFIKLFGENGVVIATAVVTVLVVIFAEVLPKTYALFFPEKVALALSPFLAVTVKLLTPVTFAIEAIVRGLFKLFRVSAKSSESLVSGADALRGAIELQLQEGGVVKHDRDMLGSILDLSETEVGEIMIHRKHIDMINIAQPTETIIENVLAMLHTRIPVYRESSDNIIGILHAKELLKLLKKRNEIITTEHILSILKKPWFIPETTKLREQLHAFMHQRNHLALVVDEYGSLMGLVTLEDILEEIVGQIEDEHDTSRKGIKKEAENSYIIEGTVTIRDLNREMEWKLPDDNATTIAGLVIHEAQAIPDVGQSFQFHGFQFQILKKQRNQITLLRVKNLPKLLENPQS